MSNQERLAIISEVGIGTRDTNYPCLWFTVNLDETSAALIVLDWEEAYKVLQEVTNIKQLDGHPCWVTSVNGIVRYLKLWSKRTS